MSGLMFVASVGGSAIAIAFASELDAAALDFTAGAIALYWLTFAAVLARTLLVHRHLRKKRPSSQSR